MNKLKLKREKFQAGSLTIAKRKVSGEVWVYRWREYRDDGTSTYRKQIIGPKPEMSKAAAKKVVEGLKLDINTVRSAVPTGRTVSQLIAHYIEQKVDKGKHTARVRQVYRHNLNVIEAKWGEHGLPTVGTEAVQDWLDGMTSYAPATRAKLKGVFGTLFRHGMRKGWVASNPIALVECSNKRVATPVILNTAEIRTILEELSEPARTVTMLAAITGMRRGELFGLKWADLDFEGRAIHIVRSVVDQIEGEPKTETSRKPLPMSEALAGALANWRANTEFADPSDWVFASPSTFGHRPYWPDMLLRRHILPAAKRLGIQKRIGWHTFRRTAATMLQSSGASVTTTKELMRHATVDMTMNLYAQAVTADKRQAQDTLSLLITGATQSPDGGALKGAPAC